LHPIADVLYQGRFSRQSLFDTFKTRGYKLCIKDLQPAKEYKGKVYRRDSYGHYRCRIGGQAVYLHRLIWEENFGPIPQDHSIIFKDSNPENIIPDNLDCRHREEIKKLYNYGNQFGYKRFAGKGAFGQLVL
jgi:hypothetical protein